MAPPGFQPLQSENQRFQAFRYHSQYLAAAFRASKLQLFWQVTKWAQPRESKKTALYNSRVGATLHALLHLAPFAAGTTLVVLNVRTTFVGSVASSSFSAVQFAAKFLEVLIQASITAMVLAYVRVHVLSTTQIPFGGLVAPFRITDISSLWSLEFWACYSSTKINLSTKIVLSTMLPAAAILAAVVGPSSAVLMIPRPLTYCKTSTLFMLMPSDLLYPTQIGLLDGRLQRETIFNGTSLQALLGPTGTFPQQLVDTSNTRGLKTVIKSVTSPGLRTLNTVPTYLSASLTSSPAGDAASTRALQPYVYTYCWYSEAVITNPDSQYVEFGPEQRDLQDSLSFAKLMPNFTASSNDDSFALHHLSGSFNDDEPVVASILWAKTPQSLSNHSLVMTSLWNYPPGNVYGVVACTIDAYWARVTANSLFQSPLSNEIPENANESPLRSLSRLKEKVLIQMEPAWAKRVLMISSEVIGQQGLDLLTAWRSQGTGYALALSYVPQEDWAMYPTPGKLMPRHEAPLTVNDSEITEQQYTSLLQYLDSNGLTQKYDDIVVDARGAEWSDPASLAQMDRKTYLSGYGYDPSPRIIKLALAVMIIYLVITFAYLIYSIGTGLVATSWDSVAELVALALNSQRPSVLQHTSVGIDTVETFRHPVNIRVNQDDSLEMVFYAASKGLEYTEIAPNEKY